MIFAFDFDGTLTDERIQGVARKIARSKNEIWVVTARRENEYNKDKVIAVLNKIFITEHQVVYADGKSKWEYLQMLNADFYIDNISDEFETIINHTNTIPLLWTSFQSNHYMKKS